MKDISEVEIESLLKLTMPEFNTSHTFAMIESQKTDT